MLENAKDHSEYREKKTTNDEKIAVWVSIHCFISLMKATFIRFCVEKKNQFLSICAAVKRGKLHHILWRKSDKFQFENELSFCIHSSIFMNSWKEKFRFFFIHLHLLGYCPDERECNDFQLNLLYVVWNGKCSIKT